MKITMTVEVGSEEDLVEARRLFNDCLSFHDTPKAAQPGYEPPFAPTSTAGADAALAAPPPAPPPPTESAAPPPPPPPPPPSDVELDTLGHPWDERFHAGSRSKIKSGEWRRKKGVKKDDVVKHFAENGTISSSTDAVVPPTPPLAPPPPPTNGEVTWEAVVQAFAARSAKYTQEQIQAALRAAIIEPTSLHQSPAQYAAAIVALDAACPI